MYVRVVGTNNCMHMLMTIVYKVMLPSHILETSGLHCTKEPGLLYTLVVLLIGCLSLRYNTKAIG